MATHFHIKCQHQNNFKSYFRKVKNVYSSLTSTQQAAKKSFIRGISGLLSDIVDTCDHNNAGGYLVTTKIDKVLDLLDNSQSLRL